MIIVIIIAILCAPLTYWALSGKADALIAQHCQNEGHHAKHPLK
jgi:uncharacterized membrane protein YwzB